MLTFYIHSLTFSEPQLSYLLVQIALCSKSFFILFIIIFLTFVYFTSYKTTLQGGGDA